MRILYICLFCFSFSTIYAQSEIINSPVLVASAGGTLVEGNYNLSFSLGEIVIETLVQSDVVLTQGFQQDNYYFSRINEAPNNYNIDIYPNPTKDMLYVGCNLNEPINLEIKDIRGGTIYSLSDFLGTDIQQVDLSKFSQGIYLLEINPRTSQKQVYKIQKFN